MEPESDYHKNNLIYSRCDSTIFGGFYFFSNRGSGQNQTSSTVDTARRDIEENYQPETLRTTTNQEDTQPKTEEQQPAQEETQPETQEQQPAQEDTQSETQEPQPSQDRHSV